MGSGTRFRNPAFVALDPARSRALVGEGSGDTLLAVDLGTGARSVVADPFAGSGPDFSALKGLTVDPEGSRAYVFDRNSDAVLTVELADDVLGDRTILYQGTGSEFSSVRDLVFDSVEKRVLAIRSSFIESFPLAGGHVQLSSNIGSPSPIDLRAAEDGVLLDDYLKNPEPELQVDIGGNVFCGLQRFDHSKILIHYADDGAQERPRL